jgi:Fatty acid cis/trans isomerase (CTI)
MRRSHLVIGGIIVAALAMSWSLRRPPASSPVLTPPPADADYAATIQPIFDHRCVPCHACFDSPCQLTLQSFEGLDRGGNKTVVYHPERRTQTTPTRMFQDAPTTSAWQSQFGFFPVVDRAEPGDLDRSLMWRFVKQRADDPRPAIFDVDTTTTCPDGVAELDSDLHEHPERGMPFGLPPLEKSEQDALASWIRRGAGGITGDPDEGEAAKRAIATWEAFFNDGDPRTPLVSAYLFEHLFYAHLYFADVAGEWFRLVRSRTPSGAPIDEIATRRPYDDPGAGPIYYRLRRIHETLVLKTHAPYELSAAKLARLRHLFYESPWSDGAPFTVDRSSANPFVTFAAIPAKARYQFLLDDAHYHVQTFIHGPVCRGQAALDVIDEQFLIFFLAPESDPAIADAGYLAQIAPDLELPAEKGESIAALSPGFDAKELRYLRAEVPRVRARMLADVWHGDGSNPNAVLTVFRHYDSAFVLRGAIGGVPKTAWLLDYPTFERMYYDLVAGFDVYGNVTHQVATRLYMNFLRIEAEGQLLRLLPASERDRVVGEWYGGRVARRLAGIHASASEGPDTAISFSDRANAKRELVTRLLTKELGAAVVGPREPIQWDDVPFASEPLRARFELAMRDVAGKTGPSVAPFPDTTLLRVKRTGGNDLVYTIVRNRWHTSVEFIFPEGVELEPAQDTLAIVSGIASSRPNLFLVVDENDLDPFVGAWKALVAEDGSWEAFVARWGARRSDPRFWSTFDFFTAASHALDPIGAAVLDLSRYVDD